MAAVIRAAARLVCLALLVGFAALRIARFPATEAELVLVQRSLSGSGEDRDLLRDPQP
jgi:hypothetical protein